MTNYQRDRERERKGVQTVQKKAKIPKPVSTCEKT